MIMISPLDSASARLWMSNAAYVSGAALTLLAAMLVFIERRLIAAGIRERAMLITEFVAVGAAIISFAGTIGAIHYGNLVSHLKDVDLATYKVTAGVQIAQANNDASKALSDVATANKKAEEIKQANLQLQIELGKHENEEKKTDAELAAETKKLDQFTQGLAQQQQGIAQQQQGMAQQMQTTPSLNDIQVKMLAEKLKPFAGQKIAIHQMSDARCQRLGSQFHQAANLAGLNVVVHATDFGPIYTGVAVGVKKAPGYPPMADALINAIRSVGLPIKGGVEPSLPDDVVGIFIGPE
jgi:uncharacterized cupredoxin-like copper-binding protein